MQKKLFIFKDWHLYIIMFLTALILFSFTLNMRSPWRSFIDRGNHQWLTASSIKFVNNWLKEGIWTLKFAMLENPNSVEFSSLEEREIYPSYPPGSILPIYYIAKISGLKEITPMHVMKYNLLNHFLLAFYCSLLLFIYLRKIGFDQLNSFLLSLLPQIIVIYNPATFYFLQNVYFSDQAILVYFVLFILLEFVRVSRLPSQSRILNILQLIIIFAGTLTDWFFIFIVFTVWILRLIRGEYGARFWKIISGSIKLWLPGIIALILFGIQLYDLNVLTLLKYKFLCRTGLDCEYGDRAAHFFEDVWLQHFVNGYGKAALFLIWLGVGVFLFAVLSYFVKKALKNNKIFTNSLLLLSLSLVPCFLQMYFFRNHSVVHRFSILKLVVPLSFLPVLIPVIITSIFGKNIVECKLNKQLKLSPLVSILVVIVVIICVQKKEFYLRLFPENSNKLCKLGNFVKNNTDFDDLVFSFDVEALSNPPILLSYTQKRIYKISSMDDIYDKVAKLKSHFDVCFLCCTDSCRAQYQELNKMESLSVYETDNFSIFKIDGNDFLNIHKFSVSPGNQKID